MLRWAGIAPDGGGTLEAREGEDGSELDEDRYVEMYDLGVG